MHPRRSLSFVGILFLAGCTVATNESSSANTGAPVLKPIGSACSATTECSGSEGANAGCISEGWPAGYCTVGCDGSACPEGTACFRLKDGAASCLKACTDNSEC